MTVQENVHASRKTARIVGALFLTSNVTFLLGAVALVEPILGASEYLTLLSEKGSQVILGVLLEFINGLAFVGIAALMFPILRQRFESMALGYVGFRVVEFIMQILGDISALSLLTLSEAFVSAGAPGSSAFQTLGTSLLAERAWAFQMLSLIFSVSGLMFYSMLYRSKLIPRFISVWGLIGAASVLVNTLFDLFGVGLGILGNLGVLMLLNELFLGVWLIVKGFNASAITSPSAGQG
jgi:hypothetical protein